MNLPTDSVTWIFTALVERLRKKLPLLYLLNIQMNRLGIKIWTERESRACESESN